MHTDRRTLLLGLVAAPLARHLPAAAPVAPVAPIARNAILAPEAFARMVLRQLAENLSLAQLNAPRPVKILEDDT
jgi:hypothetical protein